MAVSVFLLGASATTATADEGRAALTYSVSWIGNTFDGNPNWVLQDVADIFVDPDGTLFTNVVWDEGGGNVQAYRDGKIVATAFHTHGWGYEGGEAVAANSKYLFIAQNVDNEGGGLKGDSWPGKGLSWSGVSRRMRADIRKGAPFSGGHGKQGDVIQGSFLPVVEFPAKGKGAIRGLCATESRLFVSSPFDGEIKVYDVDTMQPAGFWRVDRPDKLCLDHDGNLWVLQRPVSGGSWRALHFAADGKPLGEGIQFAAGVIPSALCIDSHDRLLVADAGADQQIKIYDGLGKTPALAATLGVKGGIFAGPIRGQFGDLRFNKPTGVGTDAEGNIYVASSGSVAGGSSVIECYTPEGKCAWRATGLTFVDLAAVDPGAEVDVFSKEEHFTLDYSKADGGEWAYRGYTVDPYRYPDDPRLHLSPTNALVRRIDGRKFLFVTDMTGEYLHVYRFSPQTDGEIAIPCALFGKSRNGRTAAYPPHHPESGEWLWLDKNANGSIDEGEYQASDKKELGVMLTPDDKGSIWSLVGSEIRCLPIQGVDAHGVPMWDFSKAVVGPKPPELDQVRRIHYCADTNVMLLGGNKGADHNQHWKPMGPVLCCYDGWNTDRQKLRWQRVLPYETGAKGHESAEPISFDVAGDYLFVAYTRGLKVDKLKSAFVKAYRLSDGTFVGNLSSEKEFGETGLLDLVQSVSAIRRANGEYVVLLEDDAKAKIVMFRWRP
jgi:sugar lactone lactonase YvrE